MNEIVDFLNVNNFIFKKISKSRLYVYTIYNRLLIQSILCEMLCADIKKDLCYVSSIGYLDKNDVKIFIKPSGKQCENSNGIQNEMRLFEFLKNEIGHKNNGRQKEL